MDKSPREGEFIHWIGVDGGATSFRASRVTQGDGGALDILGPSMVQPWAVGSGLEDAWVRQLAAGIRVLLAGLPPAPLRLGIALPGTKDRMGRGVVHMARGPSLPDFCSKLEDELDLGGELQLASLGSDGEDAGRGEEWARGGGFWGQPSALFIGIGTGLAESAKIDGLLLNSSTLAERSAPPWNSIWGSGTRTVEEWVSLGSIQRRMEREQGQGVLPLEALMGGDPLAQSLFQEAAEVLGGWMAQRVALLNRAAQNPIRRLVVGGSGAALVRDPRAAFFLRTLQEALGPMEILPSSLETAALLGAAARAQGLTGSRPSESAS